MKGKSALTMMVALLVGVLAECGGGGSSTNTTNNGGGSNGGGSPLPSGTELLYVGDNVGVIHGFGIDPGSGKLTPIQSTNVTNMQAAADVSLAADSGGMVLYATNNGTGGPNVASFLVDQKTGALTNTPGVGTQLPVAAGGLAPFSTYLYVIANPNANAATMWVFKINPQNGALSLLSDHTTQLPGVPFGLAIDPSGSFVFVLWDGIPGGKVSSFSRDPNTGAVAVLPIPPADTGGLGPAGVAVTPDGKFVVVANGPTRDVSVFSLDHNTGALTAVQGSPFACVAGPSGVTIDPTGKFVFIPVGLNDDGNTLFGYTIDSAGSLTPVPGTPTALGGGAEGIGVAVDPSDKFVYTTIVGKQVAGFMIDPSTGQLTAVPGSPYGVGQVTRGIVVMPHAIP